MYHSPVDLSSAILTLFLILDPLGNIPVFLSVLRQVPPARRRRVLIREIVIAYLVLLAFLFLGKSFLLFLGLSRETLSIAGGIVLFLIAIRMIFPRESFSQAESFEGEPFVVPLAIPLFAGPSAFAALILMERSAPGGQQALLLAMTIAWAASGLILLASSFFYRVLRERGLIAMERLMGMVLVMLAVQMFMNGVKAFLAR
ncbi:MAG: YhgN family NAAT transporter [Acidobacteria bacterium]|nr:YhgN family NAAT transporter [Acidobacteriota bacterium]